MVGVSIFSLKQIQRPTPTRSDGDLWLRAPPTMLPTCPNIGSTVAPSTPPHQSHWLGQECLSYNFPPASSHSTMLKAVGPCDSISVSMKKNTRVGSPARCHPQEMAQLICSEIATQPLLLPQLDPRPWSRAHQGLLPPPAWLLLLPGLIWIPI